MHGIILYKSIYGSTKQYAEWLCEDTGFDLCEVKRCPRDLSGYDVVVLGSSVFAGRLALAGWIKSHWAVLRGKRLFLLVTHLRTDTETVVAQSLPPEIASSLRVFPVGGRYELARMSWLHRTLIQGVAKHTSDEAARAELLTDRNELARENLQPLLAALREETGN